MGLDMYLNKCGKDGMTPVAYWRKANQIRGWLIEHDVIQDEDNCSQRIISLEDLEHLIKDCEAVLKDKTLSQNLFPTTEGFFFGPQEYGEAYYEDIEYTANTLR